MNNILRILDLHKKYHTKKEEITAIENITLNVNILKTTFKHL